MKRVWVKLLKEVYFDAKVNAYVSYVVEGSESMFNKRCQIGEGSKWFDGIVNNKFLQEGIDYKFV